MPRRSTINPTNPVAATLLALLAAFGTWSLVWAQDPFAEPGTPKAAADPFGAPAAGAAPAPAAKAGDAKAPPTPTGPEPLALQQLRESNPTTPDELLFAAEAAYRFGRPDETKRYLGQLIAAWPTSEALAPLVRDFTDILLQLAREPQAQPEGKQVADAVFASAEKVARDPTRITHLVPLLADPDIQVRSNAIQSLREAGPHAVAPLLKVLADPAQADQHRAVRDALTALGGIVEQPLLGALETPDSALRAQVMIMLGRLRSQDAAWYLARPALDRESPPQLREAATAALYGITGATPTHHAAERLLQRALEPLLAGRPPYTPDIDGNITLWSWDAASGAPVPRQLQTQDAVRLLADRLATELHLLAPGNVAYLQLRLLTGLDWAKTQVGLTQPLPRGEGTIYALAVRLGPKMVADVLQDALKQNRTPAALAAIEILGDTASVAMLAPPYGESALATAVIHPDQRVRVMAALTIADQKPIHGFPLASLTREALTRAAATRGVRKVLIGHPRLGDAQSLVGRFNSFGIEGEVYLTGQDLFKAAVNDPDCEMIILTDAIDRAPVLETLQVLRKDYRTAQIPVGLMVRSENRDRIEYLSRDIPLTVVLPHLFSHIPAPQFVQVLDRPPEPAAPPATPAPAPAAAAPVAEGETIPPPQIDPLPDTIARLEALKGRNLTSASERLYYGAAALEGLAGLAAIPENIDKFELLRAEPVTTLALGVPGLAEPAARLLGLYGAPASQTALVEVASTNLLPVAERQIAVAAFAEAVRRRGLLLTTDQITRQYDRYNASEQLDVETQEVLGAVLDAIESAKKQ